MRAVYDKKALGKMSLEDVEAHNAEMRAKANPLVRGMMDEVQSALDEENDLMDRRLEGENQLRAWAETLLGVKVTMSEIEDLNQVIASATKGSAFTFSVMTPGVPGQGADVVTVTLFKTPFGTVDRLDRYIVTLEKTIVDLMSKSAPPVVVPANDQFTTLGFFGLIKLAFKQLFTRSK